LLGAIEQPLSATGPKQKGTGFLPGHWSGMLAKMAELTKLRLVLKKGAQELTAEAETHPESVAALEFLRIASKIAELDRQIELLTKDLLNSQAPLGIG
jgi:hypothetical protein